MSHRRSRILVLLGCAAAAALLLRPEAPAGPTGGWMAVAGLVPRFETLDGVRVRCVRGGSGTPLVLLHGFASSIFTWRDVWPGLARSHDVVALDFPGFGGSDQPAGVSMELYTRLVPALLDRLGLPRASLVGNSMGGAVAVFVASREPARVDRLVLLDSAGFNLSPGDRPFMVRLTASRAAGAVMGRLPVRRLLTRVGLRQVFFDDTRVTPDRVEEYVAPFLRPGALDSLRSLAGAPGLPREEFARLAGGVRAPTLIVWGREDAWIPVEHAALFATAIRGSRTVILEACGHVPQEERPDDVVRLLGEFLGT